MKQVIEQPMMQDNSDIETFADKALLTAEEYEKEFENKISKLLSPEANRYLENSLASKKALAEMMNHNETTFKHEITLINLAAEIVDNAENAGIQFDSEEEKIKFIEMHAVHDRGKEFVDSRILDKEDGLNDDEFELMKLHSKDSARLLMADGRDDLAAIAILHHSFKKHPYPTPEEIEKEFPDLHKRINDNPKIKEWAKLLSISDVVESLSTDDRPYRERMDPAEIKVMQKVKFPEHARYIDFCVDDLERARKANHDFKKEEEVLPEERRVAA